MTKVYQVWKGSNRFACWGRCIFGPDVKSLILSLFLITVPAALFCGFVSAALKDKLPGGVAIIPATLLFVTWVLSILLYAASRDPGIVPRNAHPPEPDPEADGGEGGSGLGRGRLPRTKDVIINGATVKIKYCDTCMLYRPPRCSHCSICNNCVERFDHHCPWVGQCIGKRNYRYFFAFVSSTTLLCIYVFSLCAIHIKVLMDNDYASGGQRRTVWQAMAKSPVSVVLMAYTFVAVWFVGGLTSFHTYLMITNQTTYENFRYRYDKKANPYNRGAFRNIYETLCARIPPSRNNFRAEVLSSAPQGPTLAGVPPRIPSRPISRTSSRASSGTRSPSTKEYQPLEMQRLGDDPPLKERERNGRGRRGSTDGNGEWRDGGRQYRGYSGEDSHMHYANASEAEYYKKVGQHGERNSVEITVEDGGRVSFRT